MILDKGIENLEGGLTTKKYMKMSKTTSRDMKEMVLLTCIKKVEGTSGRNVRYDVLI